MSEHIGAIAALSAALCWTISVLCWTAAGKRVGSLVTNTVRLVIALPLLMLYCWLVDGSPVPLSASPTAWAWLALSGVVGFFLCDLCLFQSLLLIGTRLALLIFSLAPLVASFFGWWWLNERLSILEITGIAIALAGVIWVVGESPQRNEASAPPPSRRLLSPRLRRLRHLRHRSDSCPAGATATGAGFAPAGSMHPCTAHLVHYTVPLLHGRAQRPLQAQCRVRLLRDRERSSSL